MGGGQPVVVGDGVGGGGVGVGIPPHFPSAGHNGLRPCDLHWAFENTMLGHWLQSFVQPTPIVIVCPAGRPP